MDMDLHTHLIKLEAMYASLTEKLNHKLLMFTQGLKYLSMLSLRGGGG